MVVHRGPAMEGTVKLSHDLRLVGSGTDFCCKGMGIWAEGRRILASGDGVFVCVDEVGEPWRMKGGGGRKSGGRCRSYQHLLY
jgi:hypothetical protein